MTKPEKITPSAEDLESAASNGGGATAKAPFLESDLYVAAAALPNIDDRKSVLTELPKDLLVEGRPDFPVTTKAKPSGIEFKHPKDWVMCHPNRSRSVSMYCLKDKADGKIYPVTRPLIAAYTQLQIACRLFIIRQAVVLDGPWFLWPAPLPGGREFPGDASHLEAMNSSMVDWTKMTWAGNDWLVESTETSHAYPHPDWATAEDFEAFLSRGLLPRVLHTGEEPFLRRFLGKGR